MRRSKNTDVPTSPLEGGSDPDDEYQEEEPAAVKVPAISVILLAAGSSSRMGRSKQLLEIDGTPLLRRAAQSGLDSGAKHVMVVLGAHEKQHHDVIHELPISIISNHYWKSGMGSSIKTGMNALLKKFPETDAVIIMVCDQPAINGAHLQNLIKEYRKSKLPIVASAYGDTLGVPALFARPFFSNILMLRDDEGAKKILKQFPKKTGAVDFPDGVHDLDTMDDYKNFLEGK